jgi:hypothetical protein
MRKITFLLLVIFMSSFILATRIIPLQEIMKPVTINLDKDQIYITEGASIYIYSLKDFKFVKKFGKAGEGPREFKLMPQLPLIINVQTDKILVNSLGKISRFTKDGQFINEEKIKAGFVAGLQPLGNRFVGLGIMQDSNARYRAVNIYDSKLNKIKEMIKVEDDFQLGKGLKVLSNPLAFAAFENKLFLSSESDFCIDVFDSDGKKLYSFKQDINKLKVSGDMKKEIIDYLKTNPRTKQFYELMKPVQFPDYLPAMRDIRIADQKIYVLTFIEDEENETSQWFIFEIKGKLLKKVLLPMKYQNALEFFPYTIHDHKLFQVVENEEEEEWELHITEIRM